MDGAGLYLDLIKRVLINWIYGSTEVGPVPVEGRLRPGALRAARAGELRLVKPNPMDAGERVCGGDWPPTAHSMVGWHRLSSLQWCVEDVLKRDVPGDLIETGTWRGGASILMRAVLKAHGISNRRVWVADSFRGIPPSDPKDYPADRDLAWDKFNELAVPLEQVQANFDSYGLLDELVSFLPGWFKDTLPNAPIERLALIRLDGDLYQSTWEGLTHLYPKLSPGGFVIADDFGQILPASGAVLDFREKFGITEPMVRLPRSGAYWQRES
jgi:hypothetical protein